MVGTTHRPGPIRLSVVLQVTYLTQRAVKDMRARGVLVRKPKFSEILEHGVRGDVGIDYRRQLGACGGRGGALSVSGGGVGEL